MSAGIEIRRLVLTAGVISLAACGGGEPDEEQIGAGAPVEQAAPAAEADTTADLIWAHLDQARYRETWRLWPGTEPLYTGTEPHGMLLTTYVNDLAHDPLTNGAATLPVRR